MSYVGDSPQAGIMMTRIINSGLPHSPEDAKEARAVKTVNISGRVAKLAWDKTVGGVHCTVAVHCTQSLQTGSQLGPDWEEG